MRNRYRDVAWPGSAAAGTAATRPSKVSADSLGWQQVDSCALGSQVPKPVGSQAKHEHDNTRRNITVKSAGRQSQRGIRLKTTREKVNDEGRKDEAKHRLNLARNGAHEESTK